MGKPFIAMGKPFVAMGKPFVVRRTRKRFFSICEV